ncbi:MAG: hypothetical protein JXO72_03190 [Vicinamibacteria bacterium]|nr:hypothetical protein [Vicinamibacteria bacterium]
MKLYMRSYGVTGLAGSWGGMTGGAIGGTPGPLGGGTTPGPTMPPLGRLPVGPVDAIC